MNRNSVELLAPAGTWDALVAALDAGADAVYLGGKAFNMRVHNSNFNFDDAQLKAAIEFAHGRGVKIYITLNNLISAEELRNSARCNFGSRFGGRQSRSQARHKNSNARLGYDEHAQHANRRVA